MSTRPSHHRVLHDIQYDDYRFRGLFAGVGYMGDSSILFSYLTALNWVGNRRVPHDKCSLGAVFDWIGVELAGSESRPLSC